MLHKIIIHNFKSYKGTHTIGPFDRFTSIIGPNGSGKSNIMDAICFVLGVGTTNLRAESLSDLITRGCESSSVDLYLFHDHLEELINLLPENVHLKEHINNLTNHITNNDISNNDLTNKENKENQVVLRRTINKAGTSTYHINTTQTPYTKYITFLNSLNIFPKQKNFLIFQGEIDSISCKSPKDLTMLVEDISGSSRLKNDYDSKFEKMTNLFEQCATLLEKKKDLSNKVKEVMETKAHLKGVRAKMKRRDIIYSCMKLSQLKRLYTNYIVYEKKKTDLETKRDAVSKMVNEPDYAFLYNLQKEIFKKERETIILNENLKEVQKKELEKNMLKEKIKYESKILTNLSELKNEKSNQINIIKKEMKNVENGYLIAVQNFENSRFVVDKKIENTFETLESQFANLTSGLAEKIGKRKRCGEIRGLERQNLEIDRKIEGCSSEINKCCSMISEIKNKMELNGKSIAFFYQKISNSDGISSTNLANEILPNLENNEKYIKFPNKENNEKDIKFPNKESNEKDIKFPNKESNGQNKEILNIEENNNQNIEYSKNNNNKKAEYEKIVEEEKLQNHELKKTLHKIITQKTTQKESEKKIRIRECIEDLKSQFGGVYGRVVDLIEPCQKKYELAVSVLLGGYGDAVVVEDEGVAVRCVEVVKGRRVGRVTFLPLSNLTNNSNCNFDYNLIADNLIVNNLIDDKNNNNDKENINNINSNINNINSNNIKSNQNYAGELRNVGVLAIDTITYNKNIHAAIYHILGTSLIAPSLKDAKSLFYTKKINTKICTLDGTLFHKNGTITTGRIDSKFCYSLNALIKKKNEIMKRLEELRAEKKKYAYLEVALEKIRELEEEQKSLEHVLEEEEQKVEFLNDQLQVLQKTKEGNIEKMDEIRNEMHKNNAETKEIEREIARIEVEVFKDFVYFDSLAQFKEFYKNRNTFLESKKNDYEILRNNMESKVNVLSEEIRIESEKIAEREGRIEKMKREMETDFEVDGVKNELFEREEELREMKDRFEAERMKCEEEKERNRENVRAVNELNRNVLDAEMEICKIKDDIFEMVRNMEMEEIPIKYNTSCDILIENLKIEQNNSSNLEHDPEQNTKNLEHCLEQNTKNPERNPEHDLERNLEQSTKNLEHDPEQNAKNLERNPEPNHNNLERNPEQKEDVIKILSRIDFSEIKEPEDHYQKEYNLLTKEIDAFIPTTKSKDSSNIQMQYSKISLDYDELRKEALNAKEEFTKIKNERINLFMDCYNNLSSSITKIYTTLTKTEDAEGNAYLLLENNTEPYKEGIKFYAMPPKKRYREMTALSGGEKTMAGLALLFALHSYRPAPFYVFDEMDSALDKENVGRVVEFMRGSSVQFVVVTLKAAFFQFADGLVGVFKRDGCSNVLTYRFD